MSQASRAFWNYVQGVSMTCSALQMRRSEDLMRDWYGVAREVVAWDAVRRQERIIFGKKGPLTTTLEYDESSFGSWETVEEGRRVFHTW
eukprot:5513112-Pyramimonas_sp.AAC.1